MKKVLFLIMYVLLFQSISSPQTGWFQQQSGTTENYFDSYFISSSTGWLAGSSTIIYKTTNSGTNWMSKSLGIAQYTITGVFFANSLTGWVCGGNPYPYNIIYKTTNGGDNWTIQTPSINYLLWGIYFLNSQTGWACGWHGTIMKTTNGGTNWITQYSGAIDQELYKIQFLNANTGFTIGTYGYIFKTTNGGENWNRYSWTNTTWLYSLYFSNANTGWIVGKSGLILKTTNTGVNWFTQTSGITDDLGSVFFNNSTKGWIVSKNGYILKTYDGGINWNSHSPVSTLQHSKIFFINEFTGWICGSSGLILKTTNGGLWLPSAPTLVSPANYSTDLTLTPTLIWNFDTEITNYKIQISTVPNFSVIKDSAIVNGTQYIIPAGKLNTATTYFWRVNATNSVGTGPWSDIWLFSTVTSGITTYESEMPNKYRLYNNFPNPFNPSTKIRFDIPKKSEVKIKIYDALGSEIVKVVDRVLNAGKYEYTLEAGKLTSGVYFYRLQTDNFIETKRMVLIK